MGGDATEDFERRRFVNVVGLLAVLALVLVGYWTFHALGHSRRFQRCLDFRPHQLRRLRQSDQVNRPAQ